MKTKFTLPMSTLTKFDFFLAGMVFILGLALYVRTLAPSLVYSDGAEFQTLSYTLGMSHPTGYPIYLLLGKLFTYIPLGNVAYRINLMSAVFGALTLGFTYLIAKTLSGKRLASLLAPLWLGTNGIFWSQSIMAEIYTTATLFTVCILLFVLLWKQNNQWLYLLIAGFLGGLAVGVHSSVLLIAPAILVYLCLTARSPESWLGASVAAIAGIAVALMAFIIIGRVDIPASYYSVGFRFTNPNLASSSLNFADELNRVFFMLSARSFGGDVFATSNAVMLESMQRYWEYLADWLPLVGLVVMGIGLVAVLIHHLQEGLLITVHLLFSLFFMFTNNSYGLYVFCIPSYVLLSLLLAFGLTALQEGAEWVLFKYLPLQFQPISKLGTRLIPILAVGCALWWVAGPVLNSWQAGHIAFIDSPGRENRYFLQKTIYLVDKPGLPYNEASIALKALPPQAIVFSEWNELYTYFYIANVEQQRTDIEIYEVCKFAQPGSDTETKAIIDYIETNSSHRPIYFTKPAFDTCKNLVKAINKQYDLKQIAGGRLWKLIPKASG